jgi:hypothetical protein
MKKILIVIGIVVFGLIGLGLAKDQILKSVITVTASAVTGAPVKMGGFRLGLLTQSVSISDLKVYNPKGFPKETMVNIPRIEVAVNIPALLQKKIHLKKVALDLKEITIIKNKEGVLNVNALKVSQKKEETPPAKNAPKETRKPSEEIPIQIDELYLNLGRVINKDYSAGEPPKTDVMELGIKNQTYKDITSVQQLITLILAAPLKQAGIQGAQVLAANALLGVAFLPAGVAVTFAGKDSAQETLNTPYEETYDSLIKLLADLKERAQIKSENRATGIIKALVDKNDVAVKIEKKDERSTNITVSARRMLLPKPEVAQGLMAQLKDKIAGK